MKINIDTLEYDISMEAARRAYHGTSFSPERRGDSVISSYIATMKDLAEFIEASAIDPRQQAVMQEVFDDLKEKYIKKQNAVLSAQSRCLSPMITGPANFPVRRNEKANNAERKRSDEWLEFHKNIKKYALKNLARAIPKTEQADNELNKQKEKLQNLIDSQERMKKVNAQFRKGGIDAVDCIPEATKDKIMHNMKQFGFGDKKPFASYVLTNNNANIKRIKARVAELEKKNLATKEHGQLSQELNGLTVIRNFEEDRLQLIFNGKPSAEIRAVLKSHGFRWSPRFTAWQRKLTNNALYVLKNIVLKKEEFKQYVEK